MGSLQSEVGPGKMYQIPSEKYINPQRAGAVAQVVSTCLASIRLQAEKKKIRDQSTKMSKPC
jgi:hypothetical protein